MVVAAAVGPAVAAAAAAVTGVVAAALELSNLNHLRRMRHPLPQPQHRPDVATQAQSTTRTCDSNLSTQHMFDGDVREAQMGYNCREGPDVQRS